MATWSSQVGPVFAGAVAVAWRGAVGAFACGAWSAVALTASANNRLAIFAFVDEASVYCCGPARVHGVGRCIRETPRLSHVTRRLSDGYVDGVEATWHRDDAIAATTSSYFGLLQLR